MTRLRLIPYATLAKIVEVKGFRWVRSSGSHNVFRHASEKIVVLPDHGAQVIVRPLLRKILRDIGISPDECTELLNDF